jgi:8-oxo-dGTP diphosphatase
LEAFCYDNEMEKQIPTHAAKAVIVNSEGAILFLQRNPARGPVANWDLPGGLVEMGESDEEALKREIKEELSLEANVGKEVGKWSFFRPLDGNRVEVTNYAVGINSDSIKLSDEHIAYKWYTKEELSNLSVKDNSIFLALGF